MRIGCFYNEPKCISMKRNIVTGLLALSIILAGFSADAQPGKKKGHYKHPHKRGYHQKHPNHKRGHYKSKERVVVVPAPPARVERVYVPAPPPRVVVQPVPVPPPLPVPPTPPLPPLPPHPGLPRR